MEDKSSHSGSRTSLPKRRSRKTIDPFTQINERPVDDINLDFFYKPHTVTLLSGIIIFLIYSAFTRNDANTDENISAALKSLVFFFLVISVLAFPNGPFTRPHPALWRMVFGLSVLYLMFLQFILFQNFQTVKAMMRWLDPKGLNATQLYEKDYAVNCSQVSLQRIWDSMDIFAFAHFLGWVCKALLIRHSIICWFISVYWEITELAFMHLLPNFQECWWDMLFLDVILCNGLGIGVGMILCRKLEMKTYKWESIKQYYVYVTDPRCKRFGTQCWVYCAITFTEAIICVKFGREIFATAQLRYIGIWIFVLLLGTILCVYVCIVVAKRSEVTEEIDVNGELHHEFCSDSSVEDLTHLSSGESKFFSQLSNESVEGPLRRRNRLSGGDGSRKMTE